MARSMELSRRPGGVLPPVNARPLVLTIDPDVTSRSVLEVALARSGFEVQATPGGAAAQKLLRAGAVPEVVVLEAELGGEDGISFVAELRGQPSTARVPVLLLTRSGRPQVEALAEVVGVDGLVRTPAYARDVVALVQVHQRRRGGLVRTVGFTATELPPALLLRALLCTPSSGRLTLEGGAAQVTFADGQVVRVRSPRGTGLEALARSLALSQGPHTLTLEPVEGPPELSCGLKELVSQVLPRLTRWSQVQQKSLPLDSRLVVDFQRLAASLDTLPDGVNRLVQLFDGFRTLEQVISDSPYNETLSLEIATRLYLMGVVTPGPGPGQAPPAQPPRLFEPEGGASKELMNELFSGREGRTPDPLPPPQLQDWFQEPEGAGLDVTDPAGGWTTAPASVLAGMPPGFPVRPETEPREPIPEARELGRFVRGEEDVQASLDRAFQELAASIGQVEAPDAAPTPPAEPPMASPPAPAPTPLAAPPAPVRGAVLGQVRLEKRAFPAPRPPGPELEAAQVEAAQAWVRGEAGPPARAAAARPPAEAPWTPPAVDQLPPTLAERALASTPVPSPARRPLTSSPSPVPQKAPVASSPSPVPQKAPAAAAPVASSPTPVPQRPPAAAATLASSPTPVPQRPPAAVAPVASSPAPVPQKAPAAAAPVAASPAPAPRKAPVAATPSPPQKAAAAPEATPPPALTPPEALPAVLYGAWPGRPTPVPTAAEAKTVLDVPKPAEPQAAITLSDASPVDPEAAFFAAGEGTATAEAPADAEAQPQAGAEAAPEGGASRTRGWLLAGAAAAVVLLLAVVVATRGSEAPAPPPPAPPPPPVVVSPPAAPEPAPEPEPMPEPPVDVSENLKLAQGFYESGQYARATSVLEQVVQDAPKSVEAWMLLGLVRFDAHDAAGARAAVAKVLALDPRNARVQILQASISFEAKEPDAAKAALNRYLELDPGGQFADEAQKLLRR